MVTTLDPDSRIPLIRYATGDRGRMLTLPPDLHPALEAAGISCPSLAGLPVSDVVSKSLGCMPDGCGRS